MTVTKNGDPAKCVVPCVTDSKYFPARVGANDAVYVPSPLSTGTDDTSPCVAFAVQSDAFVDEGFAEVATRPTTLNAAPETGVSGFPSASLAVIVNVVAVPAAIGRPLSPTPGPDAVLLTASALPATTTVPS